LLLSLAFAINSQNYSTAIRIFFFSMGTCALLIDHDVPCCFHLSLFIQCKMQFIQDYLETQKLFNTKDYLWFID